MLREKTIKPQPAQPEEATGQEVEVERMAEGEHPYYSPLVDIYESGDELVLAADMPGVSSANAEVTFENGVLTLNGRITAGGVGDANRLYQEYIPGDYHRCFTVGQDIDASRITANMRDGVLRVKLPKAERAHSRRITVK